MCDGWSPLNGNSEVDVSDVQKKFTDKRHLRHLLLWFQRVLEFLWMKGVISESGGTALYTARPKRKKQQSVL